MSNEIDEDVHVQCADRIAELENQVEEHLGTLEDLRDEVRWLQDELEHANNEMVLLQNESTEWLDPYATHLVDPWFPRVDGSLISE
jgi:uncharacterized coiled-coil protein SlyX